MSKNTKIKHTEALLTRVLIRNLICLGTQQSHRRLEYRVGQTKSRLASTQVHWIMAQYTHQWDIETISLKKAK